MPIPNGRYAARRCNGVDEGIDLLGIARPFGQRDQQFDHTRSRPIIDPSLILQKAVCHCRRVACDPCENLGERRLPIDLASLNAYPS